ncbi:MAG: rubrerythrin family protein [Candidatus Omnitrophica bacterium]|nr:rubrerythrin family protein [Candidatus Omnitrophota bacterium]
MSETIKNLKVAFAGESQANQKYRAFAKKAENDGFPNVARLFRTTAEAERIHAEGHLGALEGIGSTAQNLQAAIEGETYEFKEMYPPMLDAATAEDHKAKRMFKFAIDAEAIHAQLYKLALAAVNSGKDIGANKVYLCPLCGHIELGEAPEKCPICGAPQAKYIQV